jgi:arylsulfatase A-like enzyme
MAATLSRRSFLTAAAASALSAQNHSAQRPNILFVLVDDLGWKDFGCYGNQFHDTPHVDRLAGQGVRFTNAYAACQVCSPTRASIMTGKYPAKLQLTDWISGRKQWPTAKLLVQPFEQQLPLSEVTMAEMLKPLGYECASIGKWHLGDHEPYGPTKQGFDLNIAGTAKGSPPAWFGPFQLPGLENTTKQDFLTDLLTQHTVRFMESAVQRKKPFFVYLPEFAVHLPLGARQGVIEKYRKRLKPGQDERDATYAAMVEGVDTAVGQLMAKLEELRIADNTIVVFTSDNGGLNFEGKSTWKTTDNSPLRAGKGHIYEGGIRVPLVVRWPSALKPRVTDEPVSSVDFKPTFAAVTGARAADDTDGVNLLPVLRSGASLKREALYWHYPHYSNQGGVPAGAVRAGDWKLIEFYEDGRLELFHLGQDPGERQNLVRREPAVAKRLHGLLREWRASVNATMPKPNPGYDPATADQGLRGVEAPTPPA